MSVPPAATLITCRPRQTASSGVSVGQRQLGERQLERVARRVRLVACSDAARRGSAPDRRRRRR